MATSPNFRSTIRKTSRDLVPEKYADVFNGQDRSVIENNSTATFEIQMPLADGSEEILLITKFPIPGEDGSVAGIGGIVTEITEHAEAEAAAQRLQEDLSHILRVGTVGGMATGIAHEVNQPLAAIKNYAMGMLRRLRSGGAAPEDMTRVLELISEQAQRAGDTIRSVRRFAHRESDGAEKIDVNEAIRQVATILTNEAVDRNVRVELDLHDDLPGMVGEAGQIQQAILNLARNAMDAMDALPGTAPDRSPHLLSIRTAPVADDMIEISVADTGPGIPEALRGRIFRPVFTARPAGLGMGLPICNTIAKTHGGDLRFTSVPGEGSVFHMRLPIETDQPSSGIDVEPPNGPSYIDQV
ncbi:MAG: PAS domain-containing protein [Alphaproteobacteria bacterium]|nr:PAS domain-containing protein [Alphaproteobacteria bacterium]